MSNAKRFQVTVYYRDNGESKALSFLVSAKTKSLACRTARMHVETEFGCIVQGVEIGG